MFVDRPTEPKELCALRRRSRTFKQRSWKSKLGHKCTLTFPCVSLSIHKYLWKFKPFPAFLNLSHLGAEEIESTETIGRVSRARVLFLRDWPPWGLLINNKKWIKMEKGSQNTLPWDWPMTMCDWKSWTKDTFGNNAVSHKLLHLINGISKSLLFRASGLGKGDSDLWSWDYPCCRRTFFHLLIFPWSWNTKIGIAVTSIPRKHIKARGFELGGMFTCLLIFFYISDEIGRVSLYTSFKSVEGFQCKKTVPLLLIAK